MVPGFNHDVPHLGKAYHVQTEDLGVGNPHVVTHVFLGGSVVGTRRTSYAHMVGAPDLTTSVKEIMKEQHKQVVRNLLAGAYEPPASGAPICEASAMLEPPPIIPPPPIMPPPPKSWFPSHAPPSPPSRPLRRPPPIMPPPP